MRIYSNYTVSEQFSHAITTLIAELLQNKVEEFCNSSDQVMRTLAKFVTYSHEFRIFIKNCRMGDLIAVECIINNWLLIYNACRRKNYYKLAILQIENMYKNIKYSQL